MSRRTIAIIALIAIRRGGGSGDDADDQEYTFKGVIYQNPQPAPDFDLFSADGEYGLSDQTGKIVLMFFGYTSCPDVCPASLADMKRVVAEIKEWEDQNRGGVYHCRSGAGYRLKN